MLQRLQLLGLAWQKARLLLLLYSARLVGTLLWVPVPPTIAVCALIEHEGKLLVLDHSYTTGFGFPGGKVEPGETLETALRREVTEETGLTITNLTYATSTIGVEYGVSVILVAYTVTTTGTLTASIEGDLLWRTPTELSNCMAYQNAEQLLAWYRKDLCV